MIEFARSDGFAAHIPGYEGGGVACVSGAGVGAAVGGVTAEVAPGC